MAFSSFFDAFSGRRNPDVPTQDESYSRIGLFRGGHHYDPNQPRVPAGHSDGGQWTREGYLAGTSHPDEHRILSDATPDNLWKAGAQYATRRGAGRGGALPPTGAQLARLTVAEARANAAIREIQARDPKWRPTQSVYATTEGQIAALEARAVEAEKYLAELITYGIGPGRFACEWIPARGPTRNSNASERDAINRIGDLRGCNTCGTKDPGTITGNWLRDHQLPNVINKIVKKSQRLYPQCKSCSDKQGTWLRRWQKKP